MDEKGRGPESVHPGPMPEITEVRRQLGVIRQLVEVLAEFVQRISTDEPVLRDLQEQLRQIRQRGG